MTIKASEKTKTLDTIKQSQPTNDKTMVSFPSSRRRTATIIEKTERDEPMS